MIREKKGIELTPEGEKLLSYVKVHKQIEDEFLHGEDSGQIRIGSFSSVTRSLIMPALAPLLHERPKVSLEVFTRELSELFKLLRQGQVDYIITNKDPKREGFTAEFLGVEENVLVAHCEFPKHDIFLDHDPLDVTTSSYFALSNQKLPQRKRYLDDVYGLLDGVKMGMGRAILPKHLIKDEVSLVIQRPRTVLKVNVFLVYRSSAYSGQLQNLVRETIKQYFKDALNT